MKHIYLMISIFIYVITFFLLFPRYQYNIDADGIAYIQQARQYASGNFDIALNGCWSPLIAWILSPFIYFGYDPLLTLKYLNGFWGLATLISFDYFSKNFNLSAFFKKSYTLVLPLLILPYVFYVLGPDLLQLFIMSIYFHCLCRVKFIYSNTSLILVALIGALCYFAKAYSFYFFIIHIAIVLYFIAKKYEPTQYMHFYLKKLGLVLFAFFLFCSPFVFLISKKYDNFTISTASAITQNKSLEPSFTDGKKLTVPPLHTNAISIADDPSFFQVKKINMFTSFHYFVKQIKITVANFFVYTQLLNEISFLAITIILVFIFNTFLKPIKRISINDFVLGFSTIFYPLGYLLIAIEWRYVWLLPILLLLMSGIILNYFQMKIKKLILLLITFIILISFSLKPVLTLIHTCELPNEYGLSKKIKEKGIAGNFFANLSGWENMSKSYKIAYWNSMKVFGFFNSDYNYLDIIRESKLHSVQYFFYYYNSQAEKEMLLRSDFSRAAVEIISDIKEVVIYKLY